MLLNLGRIRRGDIFMADLGNDGNMGNEQKGTRPVVIIQNDKGNNYSPTVIVAAITSKIKKINLPIHVEISNIDLERNSVVLLEQIRTLDKRKLKEKKGHLDYTELMKLNEALKISIGL
ncbi:type II toxin-antitoxin system PemK/MazF family toxin [uncultured Clostridium sp.]|uniref:type II toxin-antitoxin system PemK/MazF family toxin n=1 Tax=uncultured Clostridium sp. TaxID=59620 RepID=UPI0025DD928E|nr:type II toxin-antitoxin system PemK/MazF family toxin [uncultured Clostridium sp.]